MAQGVEAQRVERGSRALGYRISVGFRFPVRHSCAHPTKTNFPGLGSHD